MSDNQPSREQLNRNVANSLDMTPHTVPGIELGKGLAESGATMKSTEVVGQNQLGVTFVKPDGSEFTLAGPFQLLAPIIGAFTGYKRKK
jgi:hypothetical protein